MSQANEATDIVPYIRGLWQKPDFTDLTLRLSDSSELKVHKVVVCQCEFFRAACSGDFKEAHENLIEFPDELPAAMKAFIKYLYWYHANEVLSDDIGDGKSILQVSRLLPLYDIAEKYAMPLLASATLSTFEKVCSNETCGLELEKQHNWWIRMAKNIYNKVGDHDRTLWRQVLLRLTRVHSKILIQQEDLIKKMTWDVPDFAAELLSTGGIVGEGVAKQ